MAQDTNQNRPEDVAQADSVGGMAKRLLNPAHLSDLARRSAATLKEQGAEQLWRDVTFRVGLAFHHDSWQHRADLPLRRELKAQRAEYADGKPGPVVSVVVPLYNTPEKFFGQMLASVQKQTYPHWQLVLVDASDAAHAAFSTHASKAAAKDPRILYKKVENGGIAANTTAGFALATHDLEIRGAGELLGEEQSGSMETIGFSLYMELLENAVDALKAGREPSLEDLTSQQTEVELRMPSLLPDDFIPDVNTRLSFYKRIASAKTENELEEIKVELIDRFGLLPDPARTLLDVARLRQQAQKLGIRKLEGNEKGGVIEFAEKNHVNPAWLIGLLQKQPQHYRLDGPTRLKFIQDLSERKTRIEWVRQFMRELEENAIA